VGFRAGEIAVGAHRALAVQRFEASGAQLGVGKSPARVPVSAGRSPLWQPRPWRGVIAVCSRIEPAARPAIAGDVPMLDNLGDGP
jgi:hypothetical protein